MIYEVVKVDKNTGLVLSNNSSASHWFNSVAIIS